MTSGRAFPRSVRRRFFDLVCGGMPTTEASLQVGVGRRTGWLWWRDAGGMKLRKGGEGLGGLASPGDLCRPGGRGHRISFEERLEIDRGLHAGLSYAEIANTLVISEKTVARHVSNIFTKLGLSSRAEATAYAYKQGLVR